MMASKKENTTKIFNGENFLDYAMLQGFGDLHFKTDPETGMKAIIAIHSTKLGPALGGCRFIEYPDTLSAIHDAMRLAKGMSYKTASVNLPIGGGKAVIIKPSAAFDRQAYFRAFGRFVQELNGRYITALDSGTILADMDIIAEKTPYVASLSKQQGDPSPYTARGVFQGMLAAAEFKLGKDNLSGLKIALQGLGHVGFPLAELLHEAGAELIVADINSELVKTANQRFGAIAVSINDIHKYPCDIFSPCALGAVLNDVSINELQTSIIAGAANNQLSEPIHGQLLHDRKILYAVDYVINAGGIIFAANTYLHRHETETHHEVEAIKKHLMDIFLLSQQENKPTSLIADQLAQEKLR